MGAAYTTGKSFEEMHSPGVTIVFEDLLVPLILALSCDAEGSFQLTEIMNWLEEASADSDVANAIAVTVCESLITTHVSKIEAIYPYMGKRVRDMCIMQFSENHISKATKRIFWSRLAILVQILREFLALHPEKTSLARRARRFTE